MTDTLYAMLSKNHPLTAKPLEIPDVIPLLQINENVHTLTVSNALVSLIRRIQRRQQAEMDSGTIQNLAKKLRTQCSQLEKRFEQALKLKEHITQADSKQARTAQTMLEHCWKTVVCSGFISEPMGRWLDHIHREAIPEAAHELAELAMMYREMTWQMDRLDRLFELLRRDGLALPDQVEIA